MKLINTLAISAATLASVTLASAATVNIYIVGSNGDRNATQKGIENRLASAGDWYFWGDKGAAKRVSGTVTSESNALNSGYGVWKGTYNGDTVIIKTSFIGAAGAIYAVSNGADGADVRFVAQNDPQTNFPTPTSTALKSPYASDAVVTTDYILSRPNFGLSTNFQDTTSFTGDGFDTLDAVKVGVSPIVFVASPGFPGDTITTQQAQSLYQAGSLRVSLFTGNYATDNNKIVYALGRNSDAGQRFATYGEIGLGTQATVKVWQPTIAGQSNVNNIKYGGTVTSHRLWPVETVSSVDSLFRGNGGYDSGSNLAPGVTTTFDLATSPNPIKGRDTGSGTPTFEPYPSATAAYYIGYITAGDYNTRVLTQAPTAVLLKYNGVAYTEDNVRNGKYTLWVYNRVISRSDLVGLENATTSLFKDDLTTEIHDVTGAESGGILLGTLNVKRNSDGGLVTPN